MRSLALATFPVACVTALLLNGCDAKPGSNPSGSGTGGVPAGGAAASPGGGGRSASAGASALGGSASNVAGASGGSALDDDAPGTPITFTASDDVILNPERGFYATASLVDAPDLSALRESGVTLVHSYVRLDDYRASDLPDSLLQQCSAGFERARRAGVKVILRFAYNFGPYPNSEPDAPSAWVLKHIGQLKPLIEANADVITVVQAGFIGAWGEWHTSTNNLTAPQTRQAILEALLDVVPPSRSVQLRYPPYKRDMYGEALTEANAFGATYAARVGHHNDCFVSSATDVGTYPDDEVELYRDYVGADTAFVPMGGETCAVSAPRSECTSAVAEMIKLHFSYINREFHADVLASWDPCREEMDKRLGYRLLLEGALLPPAVKPGGSFTLGVKLKNQGFAAPFNARPVFVVLRGAGFSEKVALLDVDPRRWLQGADLQVRLRLPSTLAPGTYTLSLWLPDAAPTLQARPDYALRLASSQVWDDATGENTLGTIEINTSAPGSAVSDAAAFAVIDEK